MKDIDKYINKIITGDCLSVMSNLPSNSIDLVITSPPYNLKNSTGGKWSKAALLNGYANYNDNMPHAEYARWQHKCLEEMMRLIKDDGAIFYNHKWRVQDGLLQDRQDIVNGLPVRQIIIWRRKGGINFNKGYFLPTYEVIYLIAKKNFKLAPKANAHGDVWDLAAALRLVLAGPWFLPGRFGSCEHEQGRPGACLPMHKSYSTHLWGLGQLLLLQST